MTTATFNHKGIEYTASWNGKIYGAAQKRYVEVTSSHSYGCTKMEYTEASGWMKNAGMPYAKKVALLLGFEKEEVSLSFGKHVDKKLSEVPVSYLKWLVIHANVLSVKNRSIIEDVKAFLA